VSSAQRPTTDLTSQCLVRQTPHCSLSNSRPFKIALTETTFVAPLPVESDVESVADEIPHSGAEPVKAKDEPTDTKMKEGDDEEGDEEEDGETFVTIHEKHHLPC